MKIETKFNTNDRVFFLYDNKIQNGVIYGIIITTRIEDPANIGITYTVYVVGGEIKLAADKLFKTKEALVESLL